MIWATISLYSTGLIIILNCRIAASDYKDILGNQVHPVVQMLFPNKGAVFQGVICSYTPPEVFSWFEEHKDALQHLNWPAQSPDLEVIEPLWSVLESTVRSRYPSPSSLKQLKDILHEVWYSIALENIQNLYKSIPRRVQTVLQANGGPTPY
jgi:hypothetical protein